MQWLNRATRLGLGNVLRTPSRSVLTILALAVGGAAFMVALNTGLAWDRAVDAEFEARQYELAVDLGGIHPADQVELALAGVSGVGAVETWNRYPSAAQLPTGGTGDGFDLFVPPDETVMVDFPVLEGRWLAPDDQDAVVVTQALKDPSIDVGSTLFLEIDGVGSRWTVVGRVRQLTGGDNGAVYASNGPAGVGLAGSVNQVRVAGGDGVGSILSAVEGRLIDNGIEVVAIATAIEGRESLDDHLLIIVGLLIIMAILISVVGGLGLIEAMSISVLERRRELGVMRAVGASTRDVLWVVVVEGMAIAALSWLVALVLSIPASVVVAGVTGDLFLQTPLSVSFSVTGVGLWFVIVVALAIVSSAIPALEATESPVRQSLAHE
ncbi:MAG: ABC transporter permease [Actinobacteria bacterium]|nr:ABC transporter permease [Actinomycetota bacterium]